MYVLSIPIVFMMRSNLQNILKIPTFKNKLHQNVCLDEFYQLLFSKCHFGVNEHKFRYLTFDNLKLYGLAAS